MQNNYSNAGADYAGSRIPAGMGQEIVYAGFWARLAAYVIDSAIVFAGLLIVRMILFGLSPLTDGTLLGGNILFHYTFKDIILYAVQVFYFILCTYHAGTTPGKRAMNLRVVSARDGEKLTLFNVVYRETVGRFLSGLVLCIGYILIGIDKEKRGLHDMLCDTRVIYGRKIKMYPAYQVPGAYGGTPVYQAPPAGGTPGYQTPPVRTEAPVQQRPGVPPMQQGTGIPPVQKMYPPNRNGTSRPPMPKGPEGPGVPPVQQRPGMPPKGGYVQNTSGGGTSVFEQPFQNHTHVGSGVPRMPEGGYRVVLTEEKAMERAALQPEEKAMEQTALQPEEEAMEQTALQPEEKAMEQAEVQPEEKAVGQATVQPEEEASKQTDKQEERDSQQHETTGFLL